MKLSSSTLESEKLCCCGCDAAATVNRGYQMYQRQRFSVYCVKLVHCRDTIPKSTLDWLESEADPLNQLTYAPYPLSCNVYH